MRFFFSPQSSMRGVLGQRHRVVGMALAVVLATACLVSGSEDDLFAAAQGGLLPLLGFAAGGASSDARTTLPGQDSQEINELSDGSTDADLSAFDSAYDGTAVDKMADTDDDFDPVRIACAASRSPFLCS